MTNQDLTDWREYNALFQFALRSALRDFDSAAPVTIYVFSRKQADYLQRRLGGTIRRVPDIVVNQMPRVIDPDGGPMNANERSKAKHWRGKLAAAGVTDERRLAPSAPLSKLSERVVRLINATAGRWRDEAWERHSDRVEAITAWTKAHGFEASIWSALPTNFHERGKANEPFSVEAAMRYLRKLDQKKFAVALEYRALLSLRVAARDG